MVNVSALLQSLNLSPSANDDAVVDRLNQLTAKGFTVVEVTDAKLVLTSKSGELHLPLETPTTGLKKGDQVQLAFARVGSDIMMIVTVNPKQGIPVKLAITPEKLFQLLSQPAHIPSKQVVNNFQLENVTAKIQSQGSVKLTLGSEQLSLPLAKNVIRNTVDSVLGKLQMNQSNAGFQLTFSSATGKTLALSPVLQAKQLLPVVTHVLNSQKPVQMQQNLVVTPVEIVKQPQVNIQIGKASFRNIPLPQEAKPVTTESKQNIVIEGTKNRWQIQITAPVQMPTKSVAQIPLKQVPIEQLMAQTVTQNAKPLDKPSWSLDQNFVQKTSQLIQQQLAPLLLKDSIPSKALSRIEHLVIKDVPIVKIQRPILAEAPSRLIGNDVESPKTQPLVLPLNKPVQVKPETVLQNQPKLLPVKSVEFQTLLQQWDTQVIGTQQKAGAANLVVSTINQLIRNSNDNVISQDRSPTPEQIQTSLIQHFTGLGQLPVIDRQTLTTNDVLSRIMQLVLGAKFEPQLDKQSGIDRSQFLLQISQIIRLPKNNGQMAQTALNKVQQSGQIEALLTQVSSIVSSQRRSLLQLAESRIAGQNNYHFNLPIFYQGQLQDIEILVREHKHHSSSAAEEKEQQSASWQFNLKFDLPDKGKLLVTTLLKQDNVDMVFYAEEKALMDDINRFSSLLQERLELNSIRVNKLQCTQGRIPESLHQRKNSLLHVKA